MQPSSENSALNIDDMNKPELKLTEEKKSHKSNEMENSLPISLPTNVVPSESKNEDNINDEVVRPTLMLKSNDIIRPCENFKIEIGNINFFQNHFEYQIVGINNNDKIDNTKRYSQFVAFRGFLEKKWPGVYIPFIPPNSSLSFANPDEEKNSKKFILNDFFRQIMRFKFLVRSTYFENFLKTKDDFEKMLSNTLKEFDDELLNRSLTNWGISLEYLSGNKDSKCDDLINYSIICKKSIPLIEAVIKQVINAKELKKNEHLLFIGAMHSLAKYEKNELFPFIIPENKKLVLGNPESAFQINNLENDEDLVRPYQELEKSLHLIVYRLMGFIDCIESINTIKSKKIEVQNNINADQEIVDNLKKGKSTLSTVFSSAEGKKKELENKEKILSDSIKNLDCITKYLNGAIKYMTQTFLPDFKTQLKEYYYEFLQLFMKYKINEHDQFIQVFQGLSDSENLKLI